ncbi:long-chain-fatty-acid--CoA ligase, partial [Pseudoalteromonas sp. S186]
MYTDTKKVPWYIQNSLGLKKCEKVAVMMHNILQTPISILGILRAGCVVVKVYHVYTVREVEHQLNDSDSIDMFILANFTHPIERSLS